ncbi:hypothetical protein Sjap_007679 [Stephania japonica]|uniref:F-box domain-containing protein n=1 Tax=Stephania japonica TaxID=461633 RepID=A0AAP0JQA1_9MAGN
MDQYTKLPDDILHVIMNKLSSLVCHAAFRSVCQSWRSFSLQHYPYLVLPHQPPWLMCPKSVSPPSRLCDLYTLDDSKQFYQFELPEGCNPGWCSGTWMILFEGKRYRVWNPLSLINILLPELVDESESEITCNKIVVSCPGPLIKNANDVVFGLIYNHSKLAYTRLGDKAWTLVEVEFLHRLPRPSKETMTFNNVIFCNGKLYAVNNFGFIFVCEEGVHAPCYNDYHRIRRAKAIMLIDNSHKIRELGPVVKTCNIMQYLVDVDGDLMHVLKFSIQGKSLKNYFRILKLDFTERKSYLVTKSDLGDHSLFLSATDCSASAIVSKTNWVYLRVDYENGVEGVGVNYQFMAFDYFGDEQNSSILLQVDKCDFGCQPPTLIIPGHTNRLKPSSMHRLEEGNTSTTERTPPTEDCVHTDTTPQMSTTKHTLATDEDSVHTDTTPQMSTTEHTLATDEDSVHTDTTPQMSTTEHTLATDEDSVHTDTTPQMSTIEHTLATDEDSVHTDTTLRVHTDDRVIHHGMHKLASRVKNERRSVWAFLRSIVCLECHSTLEDPF